MIFEVKNVSFSDKVKYVREKLHLSQQMLAKELGIAACQRIRDCLFNGKSLGKQ